MSECPSCGNRMNPGGRPYEELPPAFVEAWSNFSSECDMKRKKALARHIMDNKIWVEYVTNKRDQIIKEHKIGYGNPVEALELDALFHFGFLGGSHPNRLKERVWLAAKCLNEANQKEPRTNPGHFDYFEEDFYDVS